MIFKKPDATLETAAELFLTAFNGKLSGSALERVEEEDRLVPPENWFQQAFQGPANFELFVGISKGAAEKLPELPKLIEDVFQTMARALGSVAGASVTCGALSWERAGQDLERITFELCRDTISFGRVVLAVPESALSFLGRVTTPRHLDMLMNVDLPVTISFGSTEMALADVLRLTTGSIVEFNHPLSEPVNIIVNNCLVARGEVVVVDANYGVRVSEVISRA